MRKMCDAETRKKCIIPEYEKNNICRGMTFPYGGRSVTIKPRNCGKKGSPWKLNSFGRPYFAGK